MHTYTHTNIGTLAITTHTHAHTHTNTHAYLHTRAHTYAFTNVHLCICTHAQPKCTHTRAHTPTHTCIIPHTRVRTHTYIHPHAGARTHMHSHTHIECYSSHELKYCAILMNFRGEARLNYFHRRSVWKVGGEIHRCLRAEFSPLNHREFNGCQRVKSVWKGYKWNPLVLKKQFWIREIWLMWGQKQ